MIALLGAMGGGMLMRALAGPLALLAGIAALFTLCGCVKCIHCRMRDCTCCKRCLRATGTDDFDDFEFVILVHEAIFECKDAKMTTSVRITAGRHHVKTEKSSNGLFQQPLHVTVEQGTDKVLVDLLDSSGRVMATLPLWSMEDVLQQEHQPERVYGLKPKVKGVRNARVKLTMSLQKEKDAEEGRSIAHGSDVDDLVRMHLAKCGKMVGGAGHASEMETLKQASAGPLEIFESLGKTKNVYMAVIGPPSSRRWVLGIWNTKKDFDARNRPNVEVDMLRIQSVQADPSRHHVFIIHYFDASRVPMTLTFRRTDRARDVWVEVIHLLVQRIRDSRAQNKEDRLAQKDATNLRGVSSRSNDSQKRPQGSRRAGSS